MNIIAVDDEQYSLAVLKSAILEAAPDCMLHCFTRAAEGLEHARRNPVDVAFLDINMGVFSGLSMAEQLKTLRPAINLIFVTGYDTYMRQAIRLHASGYVNKPVSAGDIREELENLLNPVQKKSGIYVRTFGNFDIYVNGRVVAFSLSKAKEMLAYLINRDGASVTRQELASALFEEQPYTKQVQDYMTKIYASLKSSLDDMGAGDLIVKGRNLYAVDTAKYDSDFRQLFRGEAQARAEFKREYMMQYSWAENMLGEIERYLKI